MSQSFKNTQYIEDSVKIKEQLEIAVEYLRNSAESEYPDAQAELGYIFETGGITDERTNKFIPLIKKNIEKARELYQASADQGCSNGLNYLGSLSFNLDKNFPAAVEYFKKATQSENCPRALNNLGICFEIGPKEYCNQMNIDLEEQASSIEKDINHAADLYFKSAKQSFVPAMVNLAFLIFKCAKNN